MVLPASTAAEGEAAQAEWLRQVRRWLHLGHKGVLVMIRDAHLAQLRPLVRVLEAIDPGLTLTMRAPELLECDDGALVLLIVREEDLGWLNLNRPIFSQRSLRVVLWVEPELSGRIKFESPDLHDWISHFVPCPEGVPEFAVEGLRIGSSWWPGVAWRGPGLELALAQLKFEVTTLRPDAEFESLVSTLSDNRGSNVRWVGVDSLRSLWRVRWALAEARHEGFCVVDQPSVSTPGWFPVNSRQFSEQVAESFLRGGLMRAIELELELASISPQSALPTSEEVRVGLLLDPGPSLRQRHGSGEIAKVRQDLARAIRHQPERVWSRAQLAVFASVERDSESWPRWSGEPKRRHTVEHVLRKWTRGEPLPEFVPEAAVLLGDFELVARWYSDEISATFDTQRFGNISDSAPRDDPGNVPLLGQKLGWDAADVARAAAFEASTLLDQPQRLRAFIDEVLLAARADLGHDRSMWRIEQISAQALALAGDPWTARDLLSDSASEWPGTAPFREDLAAIHVLCGEYSRAAEGLEHITNDGTHELYTAVLLAGGQADRALLEHLGDRPNATALAREFLRRRLYDLGR